MAAKKTLALKSTSLVGRSIGSPSSVMFVFTMA